MVKFFSFPFLNTSAAGSGNVRGQASCSGEQGGSLSCCLCHLGEIRAELNPLEPSPCLWVLGASSYSFSLESGDFVTETSFLRFWAENYSHGVEGKGSHRVIPKFTALTPSASQEASYFTDGRTEAQEVW